MSQITEQIGGEHGVTVRYDVHSHHVDFFAAEVTGVMVDPNPGQLRYWRKGADSSMDDTDNFDDAERYIEGTVKWDGCSHFNFGDGTGYLHLCGGAHIEQLGQVCNVIYERCGELMVAEGTNVLEGEFECAAKPPASVPSSDVAV